MFQMAFWGMGNRCRYAEMADSANPSRKLEVVRNLAAWFELFVAHRLDYVRIADLWWAA